MAKRESARGPSRRRREIDKYSAEYYDHHYWREDAGTSNRPNVRVYWDPGHVKRFRFLAALVSSNFRFQSVLDAGCGPGGFLRELRPPKGTAVGFDASIEAARRALTVGYPVFVASLHEIPLQNDSFDLVFCSDVLEHVLPEDAEQAARELVRVARHFVVATINLDNPYEYHPTIWPRERWVTAFELAEATPELTIQSQLQQSAREHYPEYEFFVFEKNAAFDG